MEKKKKATHKQTKQKGHTQKISTKVQFDHQESSKYFRS